MICSKAQLESVLTGDPSRDTTGITLLDEWDSQTILTKQRGKEILCVGTAKGRQELMGSRVLEKHMKKKVKKKWIRREKLERRNSLERTKTWVFSCRKKCIYFRKMKNHLTMVENKEGERKLWNINCIFCKLHRIKKTIRYKDIF